MNGLRIKSHFKMQMRYTKKVSMWPVGLVTSVGLSSPVVNKDGVVVDFYDGWMANRKFPVDMAGFAVSVQLLLDVTDRLSFAFCAFLIDYGTFRENPPLSSNSTSSLTKLFISTFNSLC